ncbi:MAG: hypothetical protein FWC41_03575 [Firmicutes bacterium]|nr:hypothetical protein [Bacillota bacterium]
MLNVTECTFRRLCNKFYKEIQPLGYRKKTKLVKMEVVVFLKEKYRPNNPLTQIVNKLSKSKIAEKMGVDGQTLSKWIHEAEIYEKLKEKGYNKYQKQLTAEQCEIVKKELIIND